MGREGDIDEICDTNPSGRAAMRLSAAKLIGDSAALLRRHGLWAVCEFAALSVLLTTAYALAAPSAFATHLTRQEAANLGAVFADPVVLMNEVLYALWFGLACLRVWRAETGQFAEPGAIGETLRAYALPLTVLSFLSSVAIYAGLILLFAPGLIALALTSLVTPAVLIERRGWGGMARSLRMTGAHVIPLVLTWAAIGIPLTVLSLIVGPDASMETGGTGVLWLHWVMGDLVGAVLSTAALALVMATYTRLLDAETGGRHLPEVFR